MGANDIGNFRGAYGRKGCAWCHKRHRAGTLCPVRTREERPPKGKQIMLLTRCPGCKKRLPVYDRKITTHGTLGWACPGGGQPPKRVWVVDAIAYRAWTRGNGPAPSGLNGPGKKLVLLKGNGGNTNGCE